MFVNPAAPRPRAIVLLLGLFAAFALLSLPPQGQAEAKASASPPLPFTGGVGGFLSQFGGSDDAIEVSAPTVVPRSQWDPDGDCPFVGGTRSTPKRIQLHHTHVPVVEAPDETPAAMQSICRSHRDRFSDFGYHYAIDPYGNIWQGRGPMPEDIGGDVRNGAHAQGFNEASMGVALIGDFEEAPPTAEALEAATGLLAFLADAYDIDPGASIETVSGGGNATRFPEGAHVDLPAIAGHRDTGKDTSCPGQHLYDLLPNIRRAVAERLAG